MLCEANKKAKRNGLTSILKQTCQKILSVALVCLKLVDVKFYIENVGIRIDDNAFFLPTAQEVDDE
jgi:hypothetical protein